MGSPSAEVVVAGDLNHDSRNYSRAVPSSPASDAEVDGSSGVEVLDRIAYPEGGLILSNLEIAANVLSEALVK